MPKLDSTSWFALDSVGHVASFAPGRRGAVPSGAVTSDTLAAFLVRATCIAQKLATTPPAAWPASQAPRGSSARTPERCVLAVDDAVRGYRDGESLALLRALEPDAIVLRASGPRLLATKVPLDEAQCAALQRAPVTLGLWSASAVADLLADAVAAPHFAYEHEGAEAPPGLYRRVSVPEVPLEVRVLPEEARAGIQTARTPVRFSERSSLDVSALFGDASVDMVAAPPDGDDESYVVDQVGVDRSLDTGPSPELQLVGAAFFLGLSTVITLLLALSHC